MQASTETPEEMPPADQFALAVEVFRMLADATRVRLLWALLSGERPVNALARMVGKLPSGVSQHLAELRMARLVRARRQANQVFYRIENEHVQQLVADAIRHAEHTSGGFPQHHRRDLGLTEHAAWGDTAG